METLFAASKHILCVHVSFYTPSCSSSLPVHEERHPAADRHSLKPPRHIWDHVWSLRRVRRPGRDHRQLLGGETAGNALWQIRPNWELTLPGDELTLNLLRLGGAKTDPWPHLSTACRHRITHKHSSDLWVINVWSMAEHLQLHAQICWWNCGAVI